MEQYFARPPTQKAAGYFDRGTIEPGQAARAPVSHGERSVPESVGLVHGGRCLGQPAPSAATSWTPVHGGIARRLGAANRSRTGRSIARDTTAPAISGCQRSGRIDRSSSVASNYPRGDSMKRWPIIRHLRYFWGCWRVHQFAAAWGRAGIGLGVPNESDLRYLDAMWRGEV